MNPNFKAQHEYFYHDGWTPEMDSIILSSLLREKKAHNFDGIVIPVEFLYEAEATLEEDIGVRVNRDDIYNRLLFLERRYRSFKGLVEHAAYIVDGEPEYKQMQMMFGGEGLQLENNEEVITISETTLEAEFDDTMRSGKTYVTGQSSAAAGKQKGKMNPRKLFDDVGNASDHESTNGKGTISSNDTSCASSSPNAWWWRPYE
ncbi:hypothetical protein SASPL_135611 [Salvia splendens]|uniref:Uncharacterized protein n=1 Tax=Salvia splendens TaxID=180675 RepID=A0A8X8ZG51_SALSN|nr:hypothetical protein SASPL_135611 [Salvia splendens]